MKYKLKAFLGSFFLLIAFWYGYSFFHSGFYLPQCEVAPCEKPTMPIINNFIPENTDINNQASSIFFTLFLITDSQILLLVILFLITINIITAFGADKALKKFIKTNLPQHKEKYLKHTQRMSFLFKIELIAVVLFIVLTLPWSIRVENPKFYTPSKEKPCAPYFDKTIQNWTTQPGC